MKIHVYPQKLPLKKPFVLAHGTYHFREALIIELEEGGITGYGEATAISYYGKTISNFIQHIKAKEKILTALRVSPSRSFPSVPLIFPDEPFLQSAVDCAIWDIWAKKQNQSLYQLVPQGPLSLSAFTLSGPPTLIKKQLEKGDWPIYKIKLGGQSDAEIIPLLQNYADRFEIRIDANGGWDLEQALEYIPRLSSSGITFIEQPLSPEDDHLMPKLKGLGQAQLWADESAQEASNFKNLIHGFHGVNLKLMKSGGISHVLKQIEAVRKNRMQVGLGCMTESSFGISALAQIAGLADQLDMDGNLLLASDPATGAYIEAGRVIRPPLPGLGCCWRLDPAALHP
ncbi:MAG: hypothetical protein GVX96_06510 [Bacteroidetes bacterium]|jgi:L-alanine-DL-glutamate epimerase-like enolase superfamily enzyme|nr:hypothetical protein [Bacteroidota bacterium]